MVFVLFGKVKELDCILFVRKLVLFGVVIILLLVVGLVDVFKLIVLLL